MREFNNGPEGLVQIGLSGTHLDQLSMLANIDDNNTAAQILTAFNAYVTDRLADPQLPEHIELASQKFRDSRDENEKHVYDYTDSQKEPAHVRTALRISRGLFNKVLGLTILDKAMSGNNMTFGDTARIAVDRYLSDRFSRPDFDSDRVASERRHEAAAAIMLSRAIGH